MNLLKQNRSGRMFKEPQMSFLVFASPKSGTTWMQRLLSVHPQAVCAESRAFGDFYDPNPLSTPHLTLQKYFGILRQYFAPAVEGLRPADDSFYRTALFNFLDSLAAHALSTVGKRVYGEKFTPYRGTAERALELVREYHPAIRFVNLTRDGRDVVVSGAAQRLDQRLRRASEAGKEQLERALANHAILSEDFDLFLEYWTEAVGVGLRARDKFPHYLHLKYEGFIADPAEQTEALFRFLGLDANPRVVHSCVKAAAFDKLSGGRRRGEEDSRSFFRKGVVGDWKNWFSTEQQALFDQRAGGLMKTLGYA